MLFFCATFPVVNTSVDCFFNCWHHFHRYFYCQYCLKNNSLLLASQNTASVKVFCSHFKLKKPPPEFIQLILRRQFERWTWRVNIRCLFKKKRLISERQKMNEYLNFYGKFVKMYNLFSSNHTWNRSFNFISFLTKLMRHRIYKFNNFQVLLIWKHISLDESHL